MLCENIRNEHYAETQSKACTKPHLQEQGKTFRVAVAAFGALDGKKASRINISMYSKNIALFAVLFMFVFLFTQCVTEIAYLRVCTTSSQN